MIQPDELKKNEPLLWSTGTGTNVWDLFCACVSGDLETVRRLIRIDPSLVRCHYNYRKPLYFAVRENRLSIVAFLLERDPDPTGLAVNDSLLDIARDRGYTEMEKLLETKLTDLHGVSPKGLAPLLDVPIRAFASARRAVVGARQLASLEWLLCNP